MKYNKEIRCKIYEIAGKVLGVTAYNWLKNEWENRGTGNLLIFAEPISQCFSVNEAFSILSNTIELGPDKEFAENSLSLVYIKSEMTLDWIENNQFRINNVSQNWGIIAAASRFSWRRAEKWLVIGRPLSLIALDALSYCTAKGERQNQPLWFQKNRPYLLDEVKSEVVALKLADYLATDNVPRTKNSIKEIINNLFDTTL